MRSRGPLPLVAALLLAPAGAETLAEAGGRLAAPRGPGVVVEQVGAGSALAAAGLEPGDVLVAWERSPDPPAPAEREGEIRTVFDWLWLKTEQAPRGTLQLHAERSGSQRALEVAKGSWEARVRPVMEANLLATYQQGRERVAAGDVEGGVALWDQLAESLEPEPASHLKCWLRFEAGEAWSKVGRGDQARASLLAAFEAAPDARARVAVGEALGRSYELANQMDRAEASYRSALENAESISNESLVVARTLTRLANLSRIRNRLDESAALQKRALAIQERWAPDSLEIAESFYQLGTVAWARGDLETLSDFARRALAIQERWAPDSLEMARTLGSLAVVATERGRLDEATAMLLQALEIQERRARNSLARASSLLNLGAVARARGDSESAAEHFRQALALWEKLAPEAVGVPRVLNNLAALARDRGDLEQAAALFQRALGHWSKAAPESNGVAGGYSSLGTVAQARGDLDEAWRLYHRALEIRERIAPGGVDIAKDLRRLGMIAAARGDDLQAPALLERALAILERVAPGTTEEALTLQHLGRLHRTARLDLAATYLGRAVESLESQIGRLGGSPDLQAEFRAQYAEIYRDAIEIELERGHAAEAFHLVERSRARSFLALLAQRDLALGSELPAALERSRKDNAARYDKALGELARWTEKDGEEARAGLHRELARLRRERDEIAADIRRASPRLAALRQPEPFDLAAARQVLDPGTLALSYSVGEERTTLFALTRDGELQVETLPLGGGELRREVERFVAAMRQPTPFTEPTTGGEAMPSDLGRSLYRALIAPVAGLVESSERLLILSDGPLHRLPFGALIRESDRAVSGRGQYLAEWKPLHSALSLTVYGALRGAATGASRADTPPGVARLVAFADPRYPAALAPAGGERHAFSRRLGPGLRSFDWRALPHSRREVERIAEVYPGASLLLGEEATEERAKSVARDVRVLHFATHGYTDDRTPLDSALVLAIPDEIAAGRDNGLLQVWEILESVRLDADLVVLSACESALGRELSGEGLIGLTRAFQHAGARSVVASLWSVADQVTSELMARFHRHRATGLSTDQALRVAQVELIHQPIRIVTAAGQAVDIDASSPFFWAAFQVFGDWR